jgi:hypothetical protein
LFVLSFVRTYEKKSYEVILRVIRLVTGKKYLTDVSQRYESDKIKQVLKNFKMQQIEIN